MMLNKIFAKFIVEDTENRLDGFIQYIMEIEAKFANDKNSLLEQHEKLKKSLSDDETNEMEYYLSDDMYMIEDLYIGTYRKSTVVSIYSFLEKSLNKLCGYLYEKNSLPIKFDDLNGQGIERAKTYLSKMNGIDFGKNNWEAIRNINDIRNCIVHTEGEIKKGNLEKFKKIESTSNGRLSIQNEKYIKIEREYMGYVVEEVKKFLNDIYKQAGLEN